MVPVFRAHAETVHRVARRAAMGDDAAAEDATLQAFLESTRIWGQFRTWAPGRQRAWLCNRACKRVIDGWRSVRRAVPTEQVPEERRTSSSWSAEEIALSRITVERCLKVIESFQPRVGRVAYLRWHELWTNSEIARNLGIDRATVLRDLKRATLALEEQMGEELPFPKSSDDGGEEA